MKPHLVALLAAGLLTAADAPPRKGKDDRDRLQGTWNVVSLVQNGKAVPREAIKGATLIFEGDHYGLKGGKEEYRGSFKLNQRANPKQIDTTFVDVDDREKGRAQGIYKLEGDRLTICWREGGKGRPKAFTSEPDSGTRLIVVERVKP